MPVTPSVAQSSPGHPWIAAWQNGASPPRSGCCSSAWEQDESPTATYTYVSTMQLASNTLNSTERPIYLDRLLSNGWVCVHEAMCYMGEDLVIYCGCLQMSCQQSHICQFYTLYSKCLFTNLGYASGSTSCTKIVFLPHIYPL